MPSRPLQLQASALVAISQAHENDAPKVPALPTLVQQFNGTAWMLKWSCLQVLRTYKENSKDTSLPSSSMNSENHGTKAPEDRWTEPTKRTVEGPALRVLQDRCLISNVLVYRQEWR